MRALVVALLLFWTPLGLAKAQPLARVGQPAPELRARMLDSDRPVTLEQERGRVVLLVFVATWCAACRQLAPVLDRWEDEYRDEGLAIIATSHEPRARIRRHLRRSPSRTRWVQCTGRSAIRYGADALPTAVLIDREGIVRGTFRGAGADTVAEMRAAVERWLDGAEARPRSDHAGTATAVEPPGQAARQPRSQ